MIHVLTWTNPNSKPIELWMDDGGGLSWVTQGSKPPDCGAFSARMMLDTNRGYRAKAKIEWFV